MDLKPEDQEPEKISDRMLSVTGESGKREADTKPLLARTARGQSYDSPYEKPQPRVDPPPKMEPKTEAEPKKKIISGTVPIIFIPGLMGSCLEFPGAIYWDPDSDGRMSFWLLAGEERMQSLLKHDSPARVCDQAKEGLTKDEASRGWAGISQSYYQGILRFLEAQRFPGLKTPIYAFGYHWGRSNLVSGKGLAKFVREVLTQEQADNYILVTHSMGGFVARAGLKSMREADPALYQKALGVIHMAQPVGGAPVLVRRMFTGVLAKYDGGWDFAQALGDDPREFSTVMSGLHGPTELLPQSPYNGDGGCWYTYTSFDKPEEVHGWDAQSMFELYQSKEWGPGLLAPPFSRHAIQDEYRSRFMSSLKAAERFHQWLGRFKHPQTWSIYGDGLPTDAGVRIHKAPHMEVRQARQWLDPSGGLYVAENGIKRKATLKDLDPPRSGAQIIQTKSGDNTVPAWSAMALFPCQSVAANRYADYGKERQFEVLEASHARICDHPDCQSRLGEILAHLLHS